MINESRALLWLSLAGISVKKLNAALEVYTASELWESLCGSRSLQKLLGEKSAWLTEHHSEAFLDCYLRDCVDSGIGILTRAQANFPDRLRQKEVCPPLVLYYRGDISLLRSECVAVVGTRGATRYGKEMAERIARGLAIGGVTVVSGLAAGIDARAHDEALKAGGGTIAVLGGGLKKITPAVNLGLAERVAASGLIVSEYSPDFSPTRYSFPERNRIIAGLCRGVVVVEAGEKSGALITAEFALEQGREVYAVPGNVTSFKSAGTNALIGGGAVLATSAQDVLVDLKLDSPRSDNKSIGPVLDFFEEKIYNLLLSGERHFDELAEQSGIGPAQTAAALTSLEIKGLIKRLSSNNYGI